MKKILIIVFLSSVGFLFSCKNTNSSESNPQTSSNSTEGTNKVTQIPVKEKKETILYAWVDKLRIREQPTTKSEIVEEVKEGTSFIYMNEKTDYKERINLRGTLFHEPWLKIKTNDGKEGWVFGGAVKFYEPVVDANPTPYDKCFELRKELKYEKAFICLEKKQQAMAKKDARYVTQNKSGITFTLLDGKKVTFKNDTVPESETLLYRTYSHYLPQLGYFVTDNLLFESGNYSLINDKSGKETVINGFPKPSPDGKHILAINADGMAGFEFNGIEIYGFPNGRFKKLMEKEWDFFEPHTPIWIDNKTIQISLIPTPDNEKDKPRNIKIVMNDNGAWSLVD